MDKLFFASSHYQKLSDDFDRFTEAMMLDCEYGSSQFDVYSYLACYSFVSLLDLDISLDDLYALFMDWFNLYPLGAVSGLAVIFAEYLRSRGLVF